MFLSYSLGKNSAEALRSMPEFLEYLQDMRALMKKYKIILSEGIVVEVNELFELFLIFFMTSLAQNPIEHAVDATVKYLNYTYFFN